MSSILDDDDMVDLLSTNDLNRRARVQMAKQAPAAFLQAGGVYRAFGKRALDILFVLLMAPIVLPVMLPIILIIALKNGKPFYTQDRIGKDYKVFRMWKLRSMVVDADAKLEEYLASNPEARIEWDLTQKLKNDPRITPIGRLIRKTSLDELPQLWNVLRGDMSLVGPRPIMVSQRQAYPGTDYYDLRPGITGAWQVSARNESTFAERATYDTEYNENLSASLDFKILISTVSVVIKATGY